MKRIDYTSVQKELASSTLYDELNEADFLGILFYGDEPYVFFKQPHQITILSYVNKGSIQSVVGLSSLEVPIYRPLIGLLDYICQFFAILLKTSYIYTHTNFLISNDHLKILFEDKSHRFYDELFHHPSLPLHTAYLLYKNNKFYIINIKDSLFIINPPTNQYIRASLQSPKKLVHGDAIPTNVKVMIEDELGFELS